jgi:FdhD protein
MESEIEKVSILKLTEESRNNIDDVVVREYPLTIILNNEELVTLLCTPKDLDYLAVGFLFSEGLLENKDEIKKITVDEQNGTVRVETDADRVLDNDRIFNRLVTSGCGRGASFLNSDIQDMAKVESATSVSVRQVLSLVKDFQYQSQVYRTTGGVHGAALCDTQSILVFSEDIGRHNAIDKIFGECVLKDIPTDDRLVITSGRISSEILLKVARRNVPVIISKSAPTDLGVKLASDLGITLLGFVRGKRINVYANDWRISEDGK